MRRLVKRLKVEDRKSGLHSLCLLCLFIAILGCKETGQQTTSYSEPVYSKQYRRHSITAIVTLSETNIPTSGKIRLMVDVHAPADTTVEIPDIGNAVAPFSVADVYAEPLQTLANGKQLHRKVWMLTPGLPGSTDFQPLEILAGPETLTTKPIPIHVSSLLPPGTDSLEIKDIAEPVLLLPEQEKKRRSIHITLTTLAILAAAALLIYRLRKPKPEIIILPHEAAFQALENLSADGVEKIHQLNTILRTYIAARFNLPTAGKTTAEILPALEDMEVIRFLEKCEGIRFSNKMPAGFAEEAEQFVRAYIEQTMEVPECA